MAIDKEITAQINKLTLDSDSEIHGIWNSATDAANKGYYKVTQTYTTELKRSLRRHMETYNFDDFIVRDIIRALNQEWLPNLDNNNTKG